MRGRLFGLAYRMVGSRADAEDLVQEAYLRWHEADHDRIESAEAWLVTTTTPARARSAAPAEDGT